MSKEEILKIQKCVLKVNIHCDGCKQKVKKILQKIDGVFTTDIDADQGKVTVSGNVDPAMLIKKLAKSGKHAELWGAPKPKNNNQNQANQFKNMQNDTGKGGQGQKCGNNQPKGSQQGQQHQLLQQQQQFQQLQQHQLLQQQHQFQQLQQLQQMRGLQDLKLHPFKDQKMPGQNPNQKAMKFNLPEDDDLTDDEFDEFDDEDYNDDFGDEFDDPERPLNRMKSAMAYSQRPNMMFNGMINGQQPQIMAAQKSGSVGGNGKKGGGGPVAVPIKVNGMNVAKNHKNENGGKQGGGGHGGGGGGNSQSRGGGKQNGGNNGGFTQRANICNNGGGATNKKDSNCNGNGGAHGYNKGNGGKKSNGTSVGPPTSIGFQNMNGHPAMAAAAKMGAMGNMNNMSIAQMSNMSMGQMGSIPAVQELPTAAMNGRDGYFQGGARPDAMAGNPYHQQQQYAAAIMNQQRAMGNDRFQPMMYARPPPSVNYMPPYPYTPHPPADPYTHYFSDENTTSSCGVM